MALVLAPFPSLKAIAFVQKKLHSGVMKKTFWDVCLLVMAGACILCIFALLLAVFQVPSTVGSDDSLLSRIAALSFELVDKHHNSVIWTAVALLVLIPLGVKVLPRLALRKRIQRYETASAQNVLRTQGLLSEKTNILNRSFRRTVASDHAAAQSDPSIWRRRAS